jgi:hypothetical protein
MFGFEYVSGSLYKITEVKHPPILILPPATDAWKYKFVLENFVASF